MRHSVTLFVAVWQAAGGLDFWDNVYGFDMTHVGRVLTDSASTSKSARVTVGAAPVASPASSSPPSCPSGGHSLFLAITPVPHTA